MFIISITNVQILSCDFVDSMAIYGNGGAAFVNFIETSSTYTLSCSNSKYNRNQATDNGGAVYVAQGGEYVWRDTSFSENSAKKGGEVYFDAEHIHIYIVKIHNKFKLD